MAVKIRLRRLGRRKRPLYGVVAADSRFPRDGRFIEDLGRYNPMNEPASVSLNEERVMYWLEQGAQPSDTVRSILSRQGLMLALHMRRKGAEADAIDEAVAAHRARHQELSEAGKKTTVQDRREQALKAEATLAAKAEAEAAKARAEAEAKARAEAEEARKQAEEAAQAEREAKAEAAKAEQSEKNVAQAAEDAGSEAGSEAAPESAPEAAAEATPKAETAATEAADDTAAPEGDTPAEAEAPADAEASDKAEASEQTPADAGAKEEDDKS